MAGGTGKSLLKGVIIVIVGALLGTMLGELLAAYLPGGPVKDFLLKNITFGLDPTTVNLHILTFTIGLVLKINVLTVVGVIGAGLLLYKL